MESVFRALFIYFFLLLVIRISGNRTLSEMTTFDFVLLLIMGDASQQAITSNDYSVINAVIIIITLILTDVFFTFIKHKYKRIDKILDGTPLILINNGKIDKEMLNKTKVDEGDILEAARKLRGLQTLDEIQYAVLEKDGAITIISK